MTLIAESVPEGAPLPSIGSLRRVALPEILKRIIFNELNGTLEARASGVVRTLYFDRGFLVFTSSTAKRDRLGQRILRAGTLTEDQLEKAARLMTDGRRIGEAIVAAGLLAEEDVGRELVRQARRIAMSIFGLQVGLYRFTEKTCPIPMEYRLSLSMYRLQLEGVREMKNKKLIVASLPPPETPIRASKNVPFSYEGLRFEPIELLVMEAAQTERPILEIVKRVSQGSDEVFRAVYGLLSARILETVGTTRNAGPLKVQEETGSFLLSRTHDGGETRPKNVRQEVLLEFERTQHASPAELLHVEPNASPDEVRRVFQELRSAWDRKQWELDDEDFLFSKVDEIQRRLERAKDKILLTKTPGSGSPDSSGSYDSAASEEVRRLLREMKRRRELLQRSLEQAKEDVSQPSESKTETGSKTKARPARKRTKEDDEAEASLLLAQIKRRTRAMKAELERVKGENKGAAPEARPAAKDADTDPGVVRHQVFAKTAPKSDTPPAAESETETTERENEAAVEELLNQVEARRAAGDEEGVISVYYEIVRLCPNDAKYETLLAQALAAHPVFVRKAERHFRHAISLEPQNAQLHYLLGRHYQAMALNARAEVELKAALRIDPALADARETLAALGADPSTI